MKLYVLDPVHRWDVHIAAAGKRNGVDVRLTDRVPDAPAGESTGFVRLPLRDPGLSRARRVYHTMAARMPMVQDKAIIDTYEDKAAQYLRWGDWMPATALVYTPADAWRAVEQYGYPVIFKADTGAASTNVFKADDEASAARVIEAVFSRGLALYDGRRQCGHILAQEYVPHDVTWRVIAIGRARTVHKRHSATSGISEGLNNTPIIRMDDEVESLLAYSDAFFAHVGTQFCALDVLRHGDAWVLLETSEGWPWPHLDDHTNDAAMFRARLGATRRQMWDVLMDELKAGVFTAR